MTSLWYFGADASWEALSHAGFRRRNTWLLKAFSEHPDIERVYNARWVLRSELGRCLKPAGRSQRARRIRDVSLCTVLPERRVPGLARVLNRLLYRVQIALQTGRWPDRRAAIWCYWPEGFRFAGAVDLPGTWVFDADHDLLHDANRTAGSEAAVAEVLRRAARRCDLVVAASRSVLGWFERNGARRVGRLRNGAGACRPLNAGERTPGPPRIAYAGVLSKWVDYELMVDLAASRPDWTIDVAGAIHSVDLPPEIERQPNIRLVGDVAPAALGEWLASYDVALGLYRREPWLDVDSMKLFDYLAAGVRAVSTPYHDRVLQDFDGLLEVAATAAGFVAAIEKLMREGEASRREWDARRRRFVERNAWSARADDAIRLLHGQGDAVLVPMVTVSNAHSL